MGTRVDHASSFQCVAAQDGALRRPIRIDWLVFLSGFVGISALLSGAFFVILVAITAYIVFDQPLALTEGQRLFILAASPFVVAVIGAAALWIARAFLEYRRGRMIATCVATLAGTAGAASMGAGVGALLFPAIFVIAVAGSFGRRWMARP